MEPELLHVVPGGGEEGRGGGGGRSTSLAPLVSHASLIKSEWIINGLMDADWIMIMFCRDWLLIRLYVPNYLEHMAPSQSIMHLFVSRCSTCSHHCINRNLKQ